LTFGFPGVRLGLRFRWAADIPFTFVFLDGMASYRLLVKTG
jgi:hypothetical protein